MPVKKTVELEIPANRPVVLHRGHKGVYNDLPDSFHQAKRPGYSIIEAVACASPDFPYQPEYPSGPTMQLMIHATAEMLDKLEEKPGEVQSVTVQPIFRNVTANPAGGLQEQAYCRLVEVKGAGFRYSA